VGIEALNAIPPDPIRRLYALAVREPDAAAALKEQLRLSKAEYERLADLQLPDRAFDTREPETWSQMYIYRSGAPAFRDGLLVSWARDVAAEMNDSAYLKRLWLPDRWTVPVLPVSGKDVLALGIQSGPEVGQILSLLDQWWMAAGFPDDAALIHQRLHALVNVKER